jgi:hypothetical protein
MDVKTSLTRSLASPTVGNRAHHQERIAIRQSRRYTNERHGKLVAAIVSYEDFAKLDREILTQRKKSLGKLLEQRQG